MPSDKLPLNLSSADFFFLELRSKSRPRPDLPRSRERLRSLWRSMTRPKYVWPRSLDRLLKGGRGIGDLNVNGYIFMMAALNKVKALAPKIASPAVWDNSGRGVG